MGPASLLLPSMVWSHSRLPYYIDHFDVPPDVPPQGWQVSRLPSIGLEEFWSFLEVRGGTS